MDRIWISWNKQRRNTGLAAAMKAELFMSDLSLPGWQRIPIEMLSTFRIIKEKRPKVCFTMNPSIFSSCWLALLARIFGFLLVTDLHTLNLEVKGLKRFCFEFFFNIGIRGSHIVIVTNDIYRKTISPLNLHIVCIPDRLPDLKEQSGVVPPDKGKKFRVLLVCSFDPDEPTDEVLALDEELGNIEILVTGNWKKKFNTLPETKNIRMLGFVSDGEYDNYLKSADGIMVLTTQEGCLCCGAYEAFSAGTPLILSKTKALQEFFEEPPIYVDNEAASILEGLQKLEKEKNVRKEMILEGRRIILNKFESGVSDLEELLHHFEK